MTPTADNPILEAALRYLDSGFQPIPIPCRPKTPGRFGGQQDHRDEAAVRRASASPCNVGVLTGAPSGWLVDIALDHPLCVELADQFIPPTPAVFGRPGKPRS